MKSKYWIIILAVILIISAGASFVFFMSSEDAAWAQISSDGEVNRVVNLGIDQEFTVPCPGGYNTIAVKDGRIAVIEASCPDHYCMDRGFCNSGTAIVCLPNKLVISFVGDQEIDGQIG